jgi:hypothetical protein
VSDLECGDATPSSFSFLLPPNIAESRAVQNKLTSERWIKPQEQAGAVHFPTTLMVTLGHRERAVR